MKQKLMPYLLATTIALIALLISQVIWIDLSRRQKKEGREAQFIESFDKAFSFSAFGDVANSSTPSFTVQQVDSIPEKDKGTQIAKLDKINSYDDAAKMIENAFFLNRLKRGEISLQYLDSLIQDRARDMGKISSSRLVIYDAQDNVIDSLANAYNQSGNIFSKTYAAERIIANPDNRYTVRAEYQIEEQGNLRNMSIATVVSFIASLIIITVLFLLIRTLKRRHNEMVTMERSFHGAIHDLKSPLAFVYLSLSSMEEEELNFHKKMNLTLSADRVLFLSDKIKRMIQSGRNIQKIVDKEKQKLYLFDIVEQIETEIKAMFSEKDILFEHAFDSDFAVRVVPDLFEAALRTLIENAVKYNDNPPVVKIAAMHNDNTTQFTVEDNGIGIPRQQQKKLFRPYYTSDKKDGTGIGLYYAQSIAKAHGGDISVVSQEGKGSVFTLTIPS